MRINRSLLGWGVFLVILGIVPLAVRQGLLSRDVAASAWQLWPLLLVAAGVGLALRHTRGEAAGGLIAAVTFGLMGGGLLATGFTASFAGACGGGGTGMAFPGQQGTLGADARVSLELDCGDLTVTAASGTGWSLSGTDADGQGPEVASSSDRLRIVSRTRNGIGLRAGDDWAVTLPADGSIRLDTTLNAGSATIDLGSARVPEASVHVNAGSLVLDLGDAREAARIEATVNAGSLAITLPAGSTTGDVTVNAGAAEVCIPAGVGIRVRTNDNPLASYDFSGAGLTKLGDTWETAGYGSASARVDLTVSANAGSITLNPDDGCGD